MREEIEEGMAEEDTQKGRYLTFGLGAEVYGIEIKYVTEIIGIQTITELPECSDYVRGIINLRGKIIPVMDVRTRFRKPFLEYNDRTCIVVIDIRGISIGLIVDRVVEVLSIDEEHLVEPPRIEKKEQNRFIKRIGKITGGVMLILDCEKLLSEEEADEINETI
ncbi:MAG: purine-binding chemotaxis protein CheW [Clostridiales bacterium]|nr:purine-binding chemotaxis protein CheW [Clostridiales bacterium]